MASIIIKIEKEDVQTGRYFKNFALRLPNGIDIIFSPEALDELMNDWQEEKQNPPVKEG